MNGLISIENMSLRPVTKELLDLNEITSKYGLTLSAEEAKELSDTRNTALIENDRVEMGCGAITKIIKKFCTSRYINREDYTYILNELVYLFYYIKTETDDKISDNDLINELFERFELYCRGSIDTLEGREVERLIRKINSGDNYYKWYADRDELDYTPEMGDRETPDNYVREEYGDDYFESVESDGVADHDYYEEDYDDYEEDIDELDAFDEFLDSEAVMQREEKVNPDAAIEDMDDEEDDDDE
ncbi:MAG: DUF6323 family protein [Eubacteriales bacterium]